MPFYERYEELCKKNGIKPISQEAGELIGVTRATISAWKRKGLAAKADVLVLIADKFGVSLDYLLGRTDDPTDYTNPDLIADVSGPVLDAFDGDVKKAVAVQRATAEDVKKERELEPVIRKFALLDAGDKGRIEGYIDALLTQEKYAKW